MANIEFKITSRPLPSHGYGPESQAVVECWIEGIRFTTDVPTTEAGAQLITMLSRTLGLDKATTPEEAPSVREFCTNCAGTGKVTPRESRYGAGERTCALCEGKGYTP